MALIALNLHAFAVWGTEADARQRRCLPHTSIELLRDRVTAFAEFGPKLVGIAVPEHHGHHFPNFVESHEFELVIELVDHVPMLQILQKVNLILKSFERRVEQLDIQAAATPPPPDSQIFRMPPGAFQHPQFRSVAEIITVTTSE